MENLATLSFYEIGEIWIRSSKNNWIQTGRWRFRHTSVLCQTSIVLTPHRYSDAQVPIRRLELRIGVGSYISTSQTNLTSSDFFSVNNFIVGNNKDEVVLFFWCVSRCLVIGLQTFFFLIYNIMIRNFREALHLAGNSCSGQNGKMHI